jgi:hypothetical protein
MGKVRGKTSGQKRGKRNNLVDGLGHVFYLNTINN